MLGRRRFGRRSSAAVGPEAAAARHQPGKPLSRRRDPPELVRDLRRKAEALLAQLHANPDALVSYTFYTEEEGPIRQDIPVHEVAELQLDDLRSGSSDLGECAPDLQGRLEEGLS
jgi:hypothetical protein